MITPCEHMIIPCEHITSCEHITLSNTTFLEHIKIPWEHRLAPWDYMITPLELMIMCYCVPKAFSCIQTCHNALNP